MKKSFKSLITLTILVIALGAVGIVFAQSSEPETSEPPSGTKWGYGSASDKIAGRRGSLGGRIGENPSCAQEGLLHDELMAALADELGISVEDLEARRDAGETMAEITISTGLTLEEFKTLMADIRTAVVDAAVADGTLAEEQAEWMKTRGPGMQAGHGARGRGGRSVQGTGECPGKQSTP